MKAEDWEYESQKDTMYVHEDMYEFYQSLTDDGKISSPPATIIVKHKKLKTKNHEHQTNSLPF
jgi:hypothetical protein